MKTLSVTALSNIWQELLQSAIPDHFSIANIATDTRTLQKGDTFIALMGERFDGHDFIAQAIAKGAKNLVLERAVSAPLPQIVVRDTRLALGRLAKYIRRQFTGKVIGLTGSVGKTTSKQMLVSILSIVGKTHATKGNLNNDLGVPFTWFKVDTNDDFAIIEMGANHLGEIAYLADISQPDIALVTGAGAAHLEGFGSLAGVAQGKGELFTHLAPQATAIINADDRHADYWSNLLHTDTKRLTFSTHQPSADVYAERINDDGSSFNLYCNKQHIAIELPTIGRHHVANAVGAAACAIALDIDLTTIAQGLKSFIPDTGRVTFYRIKDLTIIDDTYNANPVSMAAAADILDKITHPTIMVLGDMAELGQDSRSLHAQLAKDLGNKAGLYYCLGDNMLAFIEHNRLATHFNNIDELMAAIIAAIDKASEITVLVKGSRHMRMERIVNELKSHFGGT